jgi:hypothetical protein
MVASLIIFGLFTLIPFHVVNVQGDPGNEIYVDDDFNDSTEGWGVTHFNTIPTPDDRSPFSKQLHSRLGKLDMSSEGLRYG